LSEGSQKVLQQAAVIGREFEYETLRTAAKLDEDTLLESLEDAERAQLIEDISEQDQEHFAFVHAMIPTTLVESARILERRRLHRRAGSAIEVLHPDNIQALAYHYLEAGETEKAVDYLIQVGDQARILYAHREAVDSYLQAVDFLKEHERLERAARTLMKLGLTYQNNFQFAESSQAYQEAFALRQRIDETRVEEQPPPASHAYRLIEREPVTLDPGICRDNSSAFAIENIFRGLIDWGPAANIIPDVARSWEVLDEGRKYIFHLREDVYWTDGVQVTAQDFEFALKRVLDQSFKAPQASWLFVIKNATEYYQGELADPGQLGIRAVDDVTIEIELEKPVGYFLHLMGCTGVMPVPRHAVEKYGEDWTDVDKIITNGPFKLISWKRGESLVYEKNPAYNGRFPGNLERIELTSLQDVENPLRAYDEDKLEYILLGYLPPDQQDRARQRCASEYISYNLMQTNFFGFDVTYPPFDDIRVRRAFTFAIDREFLSGSILRGYVSPASGGFLPPGMPGHSPGIGLSYDPEQARHLLAEAGYPGGRDFPVLEALVADTATNLTLIDYAHAQWLEILGIEVDWQILEWGDLLDRLAAEKPHLWMMGWVADYPDPHNFLSLDNWHKDRKRGVLWKNQAYNELFEKAGETMDQKERIDLYQQADKLLIEEAPILPLFHMRANFLVKPWVKGFPKSGLSSYQFKNVIIEPH
jgi:ABC-type oligopeptide transport system substrate-binding subunit